MLHLELPINMNQLLQNSYVQVEAADAQRGQ